jgi:enterochelin esterase-like enzyme
MALHNPGGLADIDQPAPSADFLKGLSGNSATRFYLSAGTLEPVFYQATLDFADKARAAGHDVKLETTVGGHTPTAWSPFLVKGLAWMLR